MRTTQFLWHLKSLPSYEGQICHIEHIPPREARYGFLDRPLPDPLRRALQASGISELYTHQAIAIKAVRDGQHVAVTTSTASGKTLCYNLPVLESLHHDSTGRALYLFPPRRWLRTRFET
jgi:DEAD/DEAH box helicase domain-containing protein